MRTIMNGVITLMLIGTVTYGLLMWRMIGLIYKSLSSIPTLRGRLSSTWRVLHGDMTGRQRALRRRWKQRG